MSIFAPPVTRAQLGNLYAPPAQRGIAVPRGPAQSGWEVRQIGDKNAGTADTIKVMSQLAVAGSQHPGIRMAAERVTRGLGSKDYEGELRAIFDLVTGNVRYVLDPRGYEYVQHPAWVLFVSGQGDCFTKGTLVLRREGHALVPIESLRVGDEIWGRDRWSRVTRTWDRGVRQTLLVALNNGSVMRLTPEHKAWIWRGGDLVRVEVCDLRPGDMVPSPDRIESGSCDLDPRRAYVEGLYVADGYKKHDNQFSISGRDGFPREEQKAEVRDICLALGIETAWSDRALTVKCPDWASRVSAMGTLPWVKRALTIDMSEHATREFLRGVLADSGRNTGGAGRTFTTSSRELHLQVRVLLKSLGITCSERFVRDHGSTSQHPVWRLGIRACKELDAMGVIRDRAWRDAPRMTSIGRPQKQLRIKSVTMDMVEAPCFDIETDDHMVWLPEADWTTSQCDDGAALLCSLALAAGHGCAFRTVAADPSRPDEFSHVYAVLGSKGRWWAADWTHPTPESATFGWEPDAASVYAVRDWPIAPA